MYPLQSALPHSLPPLHNTNLRPTKKEDDSLKKGREKLKLPSEQLLSQLVSQCKHEQGQALPLTQLERSPPTTGYLALAQGLDNKAPFTQIYPRAANTQALDHSLLFCTGGSTAPFCHLGSLKHRDRQQGPSMASPVQGAAALLRVVCHQEARKQPCSSQEDWRCCDGSVSAGAVTQRPVPDCKTTWLCSDSEHEARGCFCVLLQLLGVNNTEPALSSR